ncbi:hypothetical protein [Clostridium sp. Marseille-P2415]|uniref:hypothetical protein n=1 Tax=Clostridium sp. Marseille-P2415 TaxID=1805471 RepID=UPI00098833DE|nr:hypothetical protein [Clostridium sp. Marseille-P2415]
MKDLLEKWKKGSKEETKRVLKFLAIPLIAIVLIIVVVILDKPGQEGKEPENVSAAAKGSPAGDEEGTAKEPVKADFTLQEEAIPEIHDLMEAYFKARETCDADALSKVYGGTCTQEQLNDQSAKMEEEVKFYQSFENLVCYTAPGVEDGDYVVYARFDIKFRQAETLAPSLIVCYAKTAADGGRYLVADTSAEQSQYMEEANRSDGVQAMAKEVNDGLEKALKSDENLLAVYHILMDGTEEPEGTDNAPGTEADSAEETEAVPDSGSEPDNM